MELPLRGPLLKVKTLITIEEACLRDVSFITANLRDQDAAEIYCQLPPDTSSSTLAYIVLRDADIAMVVRHNGEPIGAFGTSPGTYAGTVANAWAFGTRQFKRAVPAITREFINTIGTAMIDAGIRRVEVRSLQGHDIAHKWLDRLGFERCSILTEYGRDGETFTLWSVTADRWNQLHVHHASETRPIASRSSGADESRECRPG